MSFVDRSSQRVALISFSGMYGVGPHEPPLALLVLQPIVQELGYYCEIIDVAALVRQGKLTAHESLPAQVAENISTRFDIACFSTRCDTYHLSLETCRLLKEQSSDILTLFGGPHATATDVASLQKFPYLDLIVRGEGEIVIRDLFRALHKERWPTFIPGTTSRLPGGGIHRNSDQELMGDLNAPPFPAYDLWVSKYGDIGFRFSEVEIGRGCPFNCNFCFTTKMWRRKYRVKPISRLIAEIGHLVEKYGQTDFHFIHDNLLMLPSQYIEDLCAGLSDLSQKIRWNVSTRMDTLSVDLLPKLSQSGLNCIFFGIEAGDDEIKKELNKEFSLAECVKTLRALEEFSIKSICSFIVGFPGEPIASISRTLEFAAFCAASSPGTTIQLHAFALEAGTELFNINIDKIKFLGPLADHVKQPTGLSSESQQLIALHPEIFSTFYGLDRPEGEELIPYGVQDIGTLLLARFPLTIGYALYKSYSVAEDIVVRCLNEFKILGLASGSRLGASSEVADVLARIANPPITSDRILNGVFELESFGTCLWAEMGDHRKAEHNRIPVSGDRAVPNKMRLFKASIDVRMLSTALSSAVDAGSDNPSAWNVVAQPTDYLFILDPIEYVVRRWELSRPASTLMAHLVSGVDVAAALKKTAEAHIKKFGVLRRSYDEHMTDLNRWVDLLRIYGAVVK